MNSYLLRATVDSDGKLNHKGTHIELSTFSTKGYIKININYVKFVTKNQLDTSHTYYLDLNKTLMFKSNLGSSMSQETPFVSPKLEHIKGNTYVFYPKGTSSLKTGNHGINFNQVKDYGPKSICIYELQHSKPFESVIDA
jgi:hypothetical protein